MAECSLQICFTCGFNVLLYVRVMGRRTIITQRDTEPAGLVPRIFRNTIISYKIRMLISSLEFLTIRKRTEATTA